VEAVFGEKAEYTGNENSNFRYFAWKFQTICKHNIILNPKILTNKKYSFLSMVSFYGEVL
jgi:hypothetical RNA pseudouridine synthase